MSGFIWHRTRILRIKVHFLNPESFGRRCHCVYLTLARYCVWEVLIRRQIFRDRANFIYVISLVPLRRNGAPQISLLTVIGRRNPAVGIPSTRLGSFVPCHDWRRKTSFICCVTSEREWLWLSTNSCSKQLLNIQHLASSSDLTSIHYGSYSMLFLWAIWYDISCYGLYEDK